MSFNSYKCQYHIYRVLGLKIQ